MASDAPTILTTSGGYGEHDRLRFQFADLLHYAVDLSGASGVVPRVCNVGTASGDDPRFQMDRSEAGRVAGVSAGSICWFQGGTTDSFGPELQAVTNGMGFLPYANGVHYDSEARRRPLVHQLVADGTLGTTHCTDDGVGMLYRGTELVEAVTEQAGKAAYIVRRDEDSVIEERLETRLLGPRAAQRPGSAAKSVTWQR